MDKYTTNTLVSKLEKYRIQNHIEELLKIYNFKEADSIFNIYCKKYGCDKEKYQNIKTHYIGKYFLNKYDLKFGYDSEQLDAIASIHQNTLVTARAGSGKTQVIAGKVAYLLDSEKLDKSEILLLSFNKKASIEVRERINTLGNLNLNKNRKLITFLNSITFHSLAYNIIKPYNTSKLLIDIEKFTDLKTGAEKEKIINKQVLFIQKCFRKIYSGDVKEIMENELSYELSQMKKVGYLSGDENYYNHRKGNNYLTLNGDYIKSFGEKYIIDFLFEYGFNITYEAIIKIDSNGSKWITKPDVKCSIPGLSREIVIEHWGFIKDDAIKKLPLGKDISSNEYIKIKNKKISYWKDQEKKGHCYFIQTSINDIDYNNKNKVELFENIIYKKIEDIFKKEGLKLEKISKEVIITKLKDNEKKVFSFSRKLLNFINKAQQKKWKPELIDEKIKTITDKIEKSFYIVANEVYKKYISEKEILNAKDFNQILEEAHEVIDIQKGNIDIELNFDGIVSNFNLNKLKYIIIDEYQDFSTLFYGLLNSILKYNKNCKLFVVGDDWQSINAFAGSEIEYYLRFRELFYNEDSTIKSILTNYRSKEIIVDMGNNLMSKIGTNRAKWFSPLNDGGEKINYIDTKNFGYKIDNWIDKVFDDNTELNAGEKQKAKYIFENILDIIQKNKGKSVMFLSRTNRAFGYSLLDWKEKLYFYYSNKIVHNTGINVNKIDENKDKLGKIKMEKYINMVNFINEKIEFITAHKSKGKQADIVVLMDISNKKYPTEEKDLNKDYIFENIFEIDSKSLLMGERKLFYVALTRAKEKIYVLSDFRYITDLVKEI